MHSYDESALVLGGRPPTSGTRRLAERIRLVLETQPGTLPYAPDFGCDLEGLVGNTASQSRLSEARSRITGALSRWLPGVRTKTCQLNLVETVVARDGHSSVPVAEAAMASQGLSAALEVRIVIETDDGELEFLATLN